jgi:DNA-binding transcriptional ArsR family regulator
MRELEQQLKALANRRRLLILKILKPQRHLSVGEIAREIKLSFKATSKHLVILYTANLVEKEQESLTVRYFLRSQIAKGIRHIIEVL